MFSEKYGYKKEKTIQYESVSDELKNRIWNLFYQSEIKGGGLSSKCLGLALNGGQTIEEKIVDRFGLLINHTGKGQSVEEQLKESFLKKVCFILFVGMRCMILLIYICHI